MEKYLLRPAFNPPILATNDLRSNLLSCSDKPFVISTGTSSSSSSLSPFQSLVPSTNSSFLSAVATTRSKQPVLRAVSNVAVPTNVKTKKKSASSATAESPASSVFTGSLGSRGPRDIYDDVPSISRSDVDWITIDSDKDALLLLADKIATATVVAFCLMWADGSTTQASATIKYCTPSSRCNVWNCCCDRHIRATQASKSIASVLFCFPADAHQQNILLQIQKNDINIDVKVQIIEDCVMRQSVTVVYNLQLVYLVLVGNFGYRFSCKSFHEPNCLITTKMTSVCLADPKIASYLCSSDIPDTDLELHSLCRRYGVTIPSLGSVGIEWNSGELNSSAIKAAFGELHSLVVVYQIIERELNSKSLKELFQNIEIPVSIELSKMEGRGILVDKRSIDSYVSVIQERIATISAEARVLTGSSQLNLGSSDQISKLLYEQLQLPLPDHYRDAGTSSTRKHPSTSESELNRLRGFHPIVELILRYRSLTKVLSTYIEGIKAYLAPARRNIPSDSSPCYSLHSWWNQTTVSTGRLSCSKPNLQNIPTAKSIDNIDLDLRSMFKSSDGCVLVAADYSQIEMRVLAHLCKDKTLMAIFSENVQGGDIYICLAAHLFSKPIGAVEEHERTSAKVICLGVIYGMGYPAMATRLGVTVSHAAQLSQSFFKRFPGISSWIHDTKQFAGTHGYVSTLAGRRRYLSDINTQQMQLKRNTPRDKQ